MAFDDIDDFQHVVEVAKENYVGFMRMAAQTGAQFGPRMAHDDRSSSECVTFLAKLVDEAPRSLAASALLSDMLVDLTEVVARSHRVANARHDQRPSRSASACTCSI